MSTSTRKATPKKAAPRDPGTSVSINGDVLRIDPEALTIGELEDFEEATGKTLEEFMRGEPVLNDDGQPERDDKGRVKRTIRTRPRELRTLVWLVKRRSDPTFTFEQARDVRIVELQLGSDPQ